MAHGANAREGVYPYREATTAHALAVQRGHDEIVRVIELAEQEQRNALSGAQDAPAADDLFRAIAAGSSDRAIALMSVDPRRDSLRDTFHRSFRRYMPRRRPWTTRWSRGCSSTAPNRRCVCTTT